ncbi:hypothetical protein AALA26_01985 [Bifidobacterium pseudolongum]|jgi:hypothetical protein|uniref:Uncharacterized protein n=1 Tax=Bifidobacterium pseudolongum subsp. globosum TaxID=1690 RepID=A0A4Q5BA42_9BIFI|nr:hypothetical protein [Bifidobacterium pseudolongum]MCH4835321.1 hypothetical protein [Bifidobacterium pseudolongum]MCH4842789.1 hypothetical protein [Bifidobacterium pseudolongum]RYQ68357.1 hypothetical protein PG2072B_0960 [Bifidobacterium pseudolongum subsp. globosum]RYQ73096.1 hypothetical protein PG2012B_1135 [Bifidobacterium pseudolongum subsp. globosum]
MTPLATIGIIGVGICLLLRCILNAAEWIPDALRERRERRTHRRARHARHGKGE